MARIAAAAETEQTHMGQQSANLFILVVAGKSAGQGGESVTAFRR